MPPGSDIIDNLRPIVPVVPKPVDAPKPPQITAVAQIGDLSPFATELVRALMAKERTEAEEKAYATFLSRYLTTIVKRI